jgi:signal transduction histidine kinase
MSLRLRLTLLYSTFMGGILLVFGATVYTLISVSLLNQQDVMLARVADDILLTTKIDPQGELGVIRLPSLDVTANAVVQVWDNDGKIVSVSPGISGLGTPMDPEGLSSSRIVYRYVYLNNAHLRVLTVPLQLGGRRIGAMQVGASLGMMDSTRSDLLYIIFGAAAISVLLVALGSWILLGRTLAPLKAVADTVDQINRADDLSRRIPYRGDREDEIGDLVESFNQTLERLESLFTSQQRFLADVSHELRTPLTVIKGNVDLMRRIKEADEESLTSIDQEAGRLTRLVGGLLMLAQAESGKLALNFKPVELDLLFTEVFTEMCVLASAKVKVHLNEIDQVMVNGDRDRLKQVLLNLTANAIQYTPQGGEVFLSMKKIGDQAQILIRDTGPGIPAEDLPHIFDRFYRAEKSRTRSSSGGFGLGLSITKWIVEHHNGRIEVESKEGKGTTFVIWLQCLMDSVQ